MSDFVPEPAPNRRGRRDPQLAEALGIDDVETINAEVEAPQLLVEGDTISARANVPVQMGNTNETSRFGYEATTTILPGETEEEANARLEWAVNSRVIELADNMEQRLAERAEARRSGPIRPR